ncbi:MAG: flagellar biosynthesis protein FlhB [Gammaproteobacteria bacterium]|nr:flagellar biosynthesis protein FlhB [Gammaproteobacteria bacterium]
MAENADGQERSEDPSQKRLDEARRKGQIPRSREFNSMVMLVSAAASLLFMGDDLMRHFADMLKDGLTLDRKMIFDRMGVIAGLSKLLEEGAWMLAPFFLVSVVAAVVSSVAIGGWSFSPEAMAVKFDKLNPLSGLKRMFALRGLVELVKSILKLLLISGVAVLLMQKLGADLLNLGYQEPAAAMGHAGQMLTWVFLLLSLVLVVIAAIDIPYQLWDHAQQMKMTKQEVRDEYKETEGKPEVKSRVRQMQRELAQRRMMEAVPEADVIITNPTHYAVALKYDGLNMRAPRLVAKGKNLIAAQIRNKAMEHEVPIFSAPPLARAIFFSTELDDEIPAGLYFAVAQVLAYIYQLKAARKGATGHAPQAPNDLSVPEEFFRPADT